MEQTLPTTRAEEIAADGPYRADWENGFSVVRDLNAPEGNKIMMMMPDNMEWFADRMNEARANGYKQGQQDQWISVEERLPEEGKYEMSEMVLCQTHKEGMAVLSYSYRYKQWRAWNGDEWPEATHWMQLPPSPPNREQR
jgi:hypothetical protein